MSVEEPLSGYPYRDAARGATADEAGRVVQVDVELERKLRSVVLFVTGA